MNLFPAKSLFLVVGVTLVAGGLQADTVYLKNGAWIDGRVRARSDKIVEVEIGKIGKVEIDVNEVYEIEKNSRTGEESPSQDAGEESRIERLTREGKKHGETGPTPAAGSQSESGTGAPPDSSGGSKGASSKEGKEPAPIDPQLKAKIEDLVRDLQRQKANFRTRAERGLKSIGAPSIPYLLPVGKSESDLTRIAVFRLFSDFGDERVVESCIDALVDANEYVRDYANRTLERVTREDFGYEPQASPRRRENAQEKWKKWWQAEKEKRAGAAAETKGTSPSK